MKCFLALVLLFSMYFSQAQKCDQHALMKPGTRLDYVLTMPGYVSRQPVELQLSLTVSRVVDSAGALYSEIIKEGASKKVEKIPTAACSCSNAMERILKFPSTFTIRIPFL